MSTALRGAGQTSWQMPQPVQTSACTMGRPRSRLMAPGTGQRSTHAAQNEVSAMQKRPWMMALRGMLASTTAVGSTGHAATAFFWKDLAKAEKNPRLETAALIWVREHQALRAASPQAKEREQALVQQRASTRVELTQPTAVRRRTGADHSRQWAHGIARRTDARDAACAEQTVRSVHGSSCNHCA